MDQVNSLWKFVQFHWNVNNNPDSFLQHELDEIKEEAMALLPILKQKNVINKVRAKVDSEDFTSDAPFGLGPYTLFEDLVGIVINCLCLS